MTSDSRLATGRTPASFYPNTMIESPSPRDRRDIQIVLVGLIAPVALGFVAAILLVRYNYKSVWKLVNDPMAALDAHPLLGVFSNIGILAWCAGATVALLSAWLLARAGAPREVVRFHVFGGGFTALLMVDDFFLIHDDLAQRYLNLSQEPVYALYAGIFATYLWTSRRELLARNPALLVLAVGLLGFMAGADVLNASRYKLVSLAMSGSKLLGIVTWAAFFTLAARRDLESHLGQTRR